MGFGNKLLFFTNLVSALLGATIVSRFFFLERQRTTINSSNNRRRVVLQEECCACTSPSSAPSRQGACRTQSDCDAIEICFAEDDSFCGICQNKVSCQTNSDCAGMLGGQVCDNRRETCLCSGSSTVCNPPCTSNSDCGLGDTCDDDNGQCSLTRCLSNMDCIPHYACSSSNSDIMTCNRQTCTTDADCAEDSGFCVKGKCYASLGFCSPPPP